MIHVRWFREAARPVTAVVLLLCSLTLPSGSAAASQTSLVSGACPEIEGNSDSQLPAISGDGRFIAFYSSASNLVPGDANGQHDVFMRDRHTGEIELVAVSSSEEHANNESAYPRVSADGRYVVFHSSATNLVPADTNGRDDIFLRDRLVGTTQRVSISSNGTEADEHSGAGTITPDGRYVAFMTGARNFSAVDTGSNYDIYVHDRTTGLTELVSQAEDGTRPANGDADSASISDDGRYIVFASATPLVATDDNGQPDIYVRDRTAGTLGLVSQAPDGTIGNNRSLAIVGGAISGDGRYVTFMSEASNLVADDGNESWDVFVRDLTTDTTTIISTNSAGEPGNSASVAPAISGDGSVVAFSSEATDLVAGDGNGLQDVYTRPRDGGPITRINVSSSGQEATGGSSRSATLSRDGTVVAYVSSATNLDGGHPSFSDVFVNAAVTCQSLPTPPGAPLNVTAASGDAQATISWAPPSSDGGSSITTYEVHGTSLAGNTTTIVNGDVTSITVGGLTNGAEYTFTVTATNAVGSGPASDPSEIVRPQADVIVARGSQTNFGKGVASLTISRPAGAVRGDLLIASLDVRGTAAVTPPLGWTLVRSDFNGTALRKFTYWRFLADVDAPSDTWSFGAASTVAGILLVYGGVDGSVPVDAHSGAANPSSKSLNAPSLTTNTDGAMLVGLFGLAIDASITPPPGMTEQAEVIIAGSGLKTTSEAADQPRPTAGPTGPRMASTARGAISVGQLVALRKGPPPTPDLEGPSAPTNLVATAPSGASVELTWSASTDNVGVDHYAIHRAEVTNGTPGSFTQVGETSSTAFTDTSVSGSTSYRYFVVAIDAAANESDPSEAAQIRTGVVIVFHGALTASGKGITSLPIPVPTGAQVGDILIASIDLRSTPAITAPPGWTLIRMDVNGTNLRKGTYWHLVGNGDPTTYGWSFGAASTAGGIMLAYGGVDSTAPIDAAGGRVNPASAQIATPSVTTSVAGAQLIALHGHAADAPITPPAGMTERAERVIGGAGAKATVEAADETRVSVGVTGLRIATSSKVALSIGHVIVLRPDALADFVEADGASLVVDGQPWYLYGASTYHSSNRGGPNDDDQIIAMAAAGGLNTLRLGEMFDQVNGLAGAPYEESDWVAVDVYLDKLRRADMRAILDLSAFRNFLVHRDIAAGGWTELCKDDGSVTPEERQTVDFAAISPYRPSAYTEWDQFISFVANRVNTMNGTPYGDDATIAVVSFAGEPNPPDSFLCGMPADTAELTVFYEHVFAEWKTHDPQHLLSNGGFLHLDWEELHGDADGSGIDWRAIFALPDNDVPSLHTYPARIDAGVPVDYQTPKVAAFVAGLEKPWFTEEFGWRQEVGDTTRADYFQWLYDRQDEYGSSGAAFWNLGVELAGGTFDVNPSTPETWLVVQGNAP